MNRTEIIAFLGYCKGLDGRIDNGEITTEAWFNVLPESLDLKKAITYAEDYYYSNTTTLMPAHVIGRHRAETAPMYKTPEICPHCETSSGWIFDEKGLANPCPKCR